MKHRISTPVPGAALFAIFFVVVTAGLLSQLADQTRYSSSGLLVAQPRFWPFVALTGMVLFGLGHFWSVWPRREKRWFAVLVDWFLVLEFVAWFLGYVYLVPLSGYLLTTIAFMLLLTFRMGYRDLRQLGIAALTGLAVILLFKTGLAVKIPGGQLYESLPEPLRSFMIVNF